MNVQSIAIPFFSESEWSEARAYMADGHAFMATYAEFLQRVTNFESEMRGQGYPTVRVQIERAAFTAWCSGHGRQIDAQARSEFASWQVLHGHGNG